jgi:hypothetical protein
MSKNKASGFKVVIEGFKTLEEAKAWISGYEGQAEQSMYVWSTENGNFPCITALDSDCWPPKVDGDSVTIKVKP